jgi:hypothetical protein
VNPVRNPYSPGAGAPPPELVGRDEILSQAEVLFDRLMLGKSAKSMVMVGLRGVGKTVLLRQIQSRAKQRSYETIFLETNDDRMFVGLLTAAIRAMLFELDQMSGLEQKVKTGLRVLRSFIGSLKLSVSDYSIELGVDPLPGVADSGNLENDLSDLFVAIAEAAKARNRGVVLLVDELQYASMDEFKAIIRAMHRIQQEQLPMALVAAGLPTLLGLFGDAKSYSERLFSYPQVGALERSDAHSAIVGPARTDGVEFEPEAVEAIFQATRGYPYFLQEWGYHVWNAAESSPIKLSDVDSTTPKVQFKLDREFFRVRMDRLTNAEKRFVRAMAELGNDSIKVSDIADRLGQQPRMLGVFRAGLIKKGMIYSTRHGELSFTVPWFDEFVKRELDEDGQTSLFVK